MAVFRMPALPPRAVSRPAYVDFVSGGEGAGVSIRATGFGALEQLLLSMPRVAIDAAGYKMAEIAGQIIEDSRANYVPYKDGYLRDSAGWDEYNPASNAGIVKIAMWFGAAMSGLQIIKESVALVHIGAKTPHPEQYAFDQHENLSYVHPSLGVVTNPQAKYLERPFLSREPSILPEIAAAVSEAWGGNTSEAGSPGVDVNTPQTWWQVMDTPTGPSEGAR